MIHDILSYTNIFIICQMISNINEDQAQQVLPSNFAITESNFTMPKFHQYLSVAVIFSRKQSYFSFRSVRDTNLRRGPYHRNT
jgi:hypothetical protein